MYYLVYKITNTTNGKTYVGSHMTENMNDRYMGSGKAVLRAIKKYGVESFLKEIMFEATTREEMFSKEREMVQIGPTSYNLAFDGSGRFHPDRKSSGLGRYWSKEMREKLRVANLGKIMPDEIKKKISLALIGKKKKPFSEEHRKNISLSHIGKNTGKHGPMSEETKEKLRLINTGKRYSEETKKKHSLAMSGIVYIYKDSITKRVTPLELDSFLATGWSKGGGLLWEKRNGKRK